MARRGAPEAVLVADQWLAVIQPDGIY